MALSERVGTTPALRSLWKLKAPPRVLVFGWLALRNRILTMNNLRRGGMVVVNACPLCLKDEEFVDHILLKRNFAHRTWSVVLGWFGFSWVLPNSLSDPFEAWICPSMAPRGKEMWKLSFLAVIWIIWKKRNTRHFKGIASCVNSITDKIKLFVALWVSINPNFQGILLDQVLLNWKEISPSY